MANSNGAAPARLASFPASWAAQHEAAYRAAEQDIALLQPGEALLYHEGHLAIDAGHDPAIAGRAAAVRDAAAAGRGSIAQRRLQVDHYQYFFWRGRHERN
jgi:hypothetical protein